jgi:cold shock CspA family protein
MTMSARYSGTLTAWVEAEGFGEIQPDGSLGRQIVRLPALQMAGIEPVVGDKLTFELSNDGATVGAVNIERAA